MSQLDLNGNSSETLDEIVWRKITKMHAKGCYDTREIARALLKDGELPGDWKDARLLVDATTLVADVSTRRQVSGLSRSLKLEKPHQYRLRDWCDFDEKLENLKLKIGMWQADGNAIRVDAGAIMKEHPRHKNLVMAVLPGALRPSEK